MKTGEPIRRSRAAGWARLIGALSLPVLVLAALTTRAGVIPADAHIPVVTLGFGLGLLALTLGIYALADVWKSAAEGAESAIIGIVYASPALAALALVATAAVIYPKLSDVSTDLVDPPPLAVASTAATQPNEQAIAEQQESYPDLVPHAYPLSFEEVHQAARALAEDRGWEITSEIRPDVPAAGPFGAPVAVPDEALMQATTTTMLFAFTDDLAIRVRETSEGAVVDMRSASRAGTHDLGQNARRVRAYFRDLDQIIQSSAVATPAPPAPEPEPEPELEAAEPPSE